MFKVMIIDDEPIIVEGIKKIVPWEKYGCQIIATANDGIEGGRLIRELKPDILFSDISMPGVDGLTMVAALRSEFPNIKISILTGYRDFDYAQKAISLGVSRYLLKPSNLAEIEEAIVAMTEGMIPSENEDEPKREEAEEDCETKAASSFIVYNAVQYMEENYNRKITLSEVAEKTYISQWHLSKLLNKNMGLNFSEILNNIRVKEAKRLLMNSSMRIGDIAWEVGFTDIAHFSKVFKKLTGLSANEYRNSILVKKMMDAEKK
ncbi:response regulator transcription factor [Anaerocolumna xylanovorans]|uniref:Stage 0 sporulation protein A homolog n=1 Tax=Anaerocolumna xylanovorans DSM 12503 TaxID=1121345 RepID=A0A1M7YGN3_9FIRM|nr:response regulator [Anaerocolumna xylanovorans]SHO51780.1 Helix-turn-helix domain-containing protein [Anaerocolumna xylanovorans DSM 12503]